MRYLVFITDPGCTILQLKGAALNATDRRSTINFYMMLLACDF